MELDSAGGTAALPPKQARCRAPIALRGRLQLVPRGGARQGCVAASLSASGAASSFAADRGSVGADGAVDSADGDVADAGALTP